MQEADFAWTVFGLSVQEMAAVRHGPDIETVLKRMMSDVLAALRVRDVISNLLL